MKVTASILCLLLMLLNGLPPSAEAHWDVTGFFDGSLHFEKDKHQYPDNNTQIQFLVTDETGDNADYENEDPEPLFSECANTVHFVSYDYPSEYFLKSKTYSLLARAKTSFALNGVPVYIQQRVLRI